MDRLVPWDLQTQKDRSVTLAQRVAVPPPPETIRAPFAERLGVAAASSALIALAAAAGVGAVALFASNAVLALVLGASALTIGALAAYMTRDAVGRWRLVANVHMNRLAAFLPRKRGFAPLAREEIVVGFQNVDRIETREEVFSSFGVTTSQRAYSLVLKEGGRIVLGADRAMLPAHVRRIVEAVRARHDAPLVDRGMIDGDAGFMLVAGVKVPDWSAPPLAAAEVDRRIRARNRTPALLLIAAAFTILTRLVEAFRT